MGEGRQGAATQHGAIGNELRPEIAIALGVMDGKSANNDGPRTMKEVLKADTYKG